MKTIYDQCKHAYESRFHIQQLSADLKITVLHAISNALVLHSDTILSANQIDMDNGSQLSSALQDRLLLTSDRIHSIASSIQEIASLDDPIGTLLEEWDRPNGLHIKKIRVPLGCIGMIYEARPNVTADAIAIGIKTSNAMILRGSASAYHTNKAIVDCIKETLASYDIPPHFIQLLEDTRRESVKEFVTLNQFLNLIIPRGGAQLIQHVIHSATVPTIETGVGNCHVYIDQFANIHKALSIADNSKTQRPSVCNACETILVHQIVSSEFLSQLDPIFFKKNVLVKGCEKTVLLMPHACLASDEDWDTEYLNFTVAIKVVDSIQDSVSHINHHGTLHTEAIVSENDDSIHYFTHHVDASSIIVNASTRFTDGGEFGFGAELGISTQKLHARGPMGIKELTSYKYIVEGDGHIR